jgi:class 3 adenylate cyclase
VSVSAAAAPSGVVTFLFTDIEGSTRRWEADADAMRVALAAHDDVLRTAIEGHGGWLFKHTGDDVCAAFATAFTRASYPQLNTTIGHLRDVLGAEAYESLARTGETMTTADMVAYAYDQIDRARPALNATS